jgi:type IV pilus modification protein PilV
MNLHRLGRRQRGFSLIEALIAMVVLAFGMLAIASFQMNLSRNSDLAKQRAEATRLAQERMEELRSFATFAGYAALTAGTDTPAAGSNVTYTRTWSFPDGSTAADPRRVVKVAVEWTDRTGEQQREVDGRGVVLISVLAEADATEAGGLAVPTIENGILRRPFARNINIPIPAVMLGGGNQGYSTLGWGGASGGWLVFSNVSGDVVYKCATQPEDNTNIPSSCTAVLGYLLLGFVNGSWVSSITSATIGSMSPAGATSECYIADALDPNSSTVTVITGYKLYSCLVQAVDHDNDSATPRRWSGRLTLAAAPTGSQRVCRYNGNQTNSSGLYQDITTSLDNQNYLLEIGSCPSGTTQHQP